MRARSGRSITTPVIKRLSIPQSSQLTAPVMVPRYISDDEVCSWPGGVNNHLQVESELSEENWVDLSAVIEPVESFVEKLNEGNENDGQSSETKKGRN